MSDRIALHQRAEFGLPVVRAAGEAVLAKREQVKTQPASPNASKQALGKTPSRNKYGAKKVVTEEGVFDSKLEYRRWLELRTMERARLITNLERQIEYKLEVNGVKIGIFTVDHRWEAGGKVWVEDVKGAPPSRDFPLRVKLLKAIYGVDVQIWPERKRKTRKRSAK